MLCGNRCVATTGKCARTNVNIGKIDQGWGLDQYPISFTSATAWSEFVSLPYASHHQTVGVCFEKVISDAHSLLLSQAIGSISLTRPVVNLLALPRQIRAEYLALTSAPTYNDFLYRVDYHEDLRWAEMRVLKRIDQTNLGYQSVQLLHRGKR